jgi:molybdopterin-guanine dinucleotide biosynthesis protein B
MDPPVLGFAAYSGTGKTTLLTRLLPLLRDRGLRIGMVKHAHHSFDIDHPGKDSYELRSAGACQMLVASRHRWALMTELEREQEPDLGELVERLDRVDLDLILVEGFKQVAFPKIELYRPALGHTPMFPQDPNIIAVATDGPIDTDLPRLQLNDPGAIAEFVLHWCQDQEMATLRSQ